MESKQPFRVEYGAKGVYANVTLRVLESCVTDKLTLFLPSCDVERANILGDPMYGVVKHIIIHKDGMRYIFDHTQEIKLSLDAQDTFAQCCTKWKDIAMNTKLAKGNFANSKTKILQLLSLLFLDSQSTVMQIHSADEGCLSMMLANIVKSPKNQLLVHDEDHMHCQDVLDNMFFQNPAAEKFLVRAHPAVPTVDFDTLIVHGKDQFYKYFQEFGPMALSSIRTLILTHDYSNPEHKEYIRVVLTSLGFESAYIHAQDADLSFYEVWVRPIHKTNTGPIVIHR